MITGKVMIPNEMPRVCRQGLLDTMRENLKLWTVSRERSGVASPASEANSISRRWRKPLSMI
jgi:hypothetical protein